MTNIALLGAGGKMGVRLSKNLKQSRFNVSHVEISDDGRRRLHEEVGVETVDQVTALAGADVVILAVPDRLIGKISHAIVHHLQPGTAVIVLDAAAPYAGETAGTRRCDVFLHPSMPSGIVRFHA